MVPNQQIEADTMVQSQQMVLQDPCHDLAWILDAAIAQNRSSREQDKEAGVLKPAHMASLNKFFRELESRVGHSFQPPHNLLAGCTSGLLHVRTAKPNTGSPAFRLSLFP